MNAHRSRWFVLFALVAACATSDDDARPKEAPLPDDAVFEETVVELRGEEALVVSKRALTVGEARRDNRARANRANRPEEVQLAPDWGCNGAALWLYDRTDWTGNRICFLGAGTADLSTYWRFADGYWQTWELGHGAFWPGVSSGQIVGTTVPDEAYWIDANYSDPMPPPLEQVWPFASWGPREAFYGFILYNRVRLF